MDGVVPGHGGNVRPCEYFDLMGGSGPSGLACLLFAKFALTVNQVIEFLETLSSRLDDIEQLYQRGKPPYLQQNEWDRYEQRFRNPVERLEMLRQLEMDEVWLDTIKSNFDDWLDRVSFMDRDKFDFKLPPVDTGVARAKAAVVSSESPGLNGGTSEDRRYNVPLLHRTYYTRYSSPLYTFYAVGLGTFGAPGVAKPGVSFPDFLATGRHTIHNPTRLLLEECSRLWPGLEIGTLISVGTGKFEAMPESWNYDTHPLGYNNCIACFLIYKHNQKEVTETQKYILPFDAKLRNAYSRFELPGTSPFFEYAARTKISSDTRAWMRSDMPADQCRLVSTALKTDAFPTHEEFQVALSCLASLFEAFHILGYYEEARLLSDIFANLFLYEEASNRADPRRMIKIAVDAECLSWLVRHGKPLSFSGEFKSSMMENSIDGCALSFLIDPDTFHPARKPGGNLPTELSQLSDLAAGAFYMIQICKKDDLILRSTEAFEKISRQLSILGATTPSVTETNLEQLKYFMQVISLAALCEAGTIEGLRGYKRLLYNGSFIRHLHNTVSTVKLENIGDQILAPIANAVALSIQLNTWSDFRDNTITKLLTSRSPNTIHFWSFVNLAIVRVERGARFSSISSQSDDLTDHSKVLLACERILSQANAVMKEQLLEVIVLSTKNGYATLLRKCLLDERLDVVSGTPMPTALAPTLIDRTTDDNGETLIHIAARRGFPETLRSIAECLGMQAAREAINRPNVLGQTALHLACMGRASLRFFDICWKLQANVRVQCKVGRTPLHYCFPGSSSLPDYYSALSEMVETGSLPTTFPHGRGLNKAGKPLGPRANDFEDIIVELLKHRAPINLQDRDGMTPVHLAAKEGYGHMLTIIFQGFSGGKYQTSEGDCLTIRDKDGLLALDHARMSNDIEAERTISRLLSKRATQVDELLPARQLKGHSPPRSDAVLRYRGDIEFEQELDLKLSTVLDSLTLQPQVQNVESSFQAPVHDFSGSSSPSRSVREGSMSSDKSSEHPFPASHRGRRWVTQQDNELIGNPILQHGSALESTSDRSDSLNRETRFVVTTRGRSRSTQSSVVIRRQIVEEDAAEKLEVLGPDMVAAWSNLSNVNRLCKRCESTLTGLDDDLELPIGDGDSDYEKGSRDIWSESTGPTISQLRATAHRGCHFCTLLLTRWIDDRRNLRLGAEDTGCGGNRKYQDRLYENDRVHLRLVANRQGDGRRLAGGVTLWCAKGDRHESSLVDNVGFWKLSSRRRARNSDEPGPDCMEYRHELANFGFRLGRPSQTASSMWHPEKYGILPPKGNTAPMTLKNGRFVPVEITYDTISTEQTSSQKRAARNFSHRKKVDVSDSAEDIARYWLEDCTANHTCLLDAQDRPLPTRVIDVQKEPFLVQSDGRCGRYATLSYQWGQCRLLKTTSDTLKAHHNSIPMHRMPKTFRDVIKLTRTLGLRYLWIDSLCILQDSVEDCQRELDSMPDIYANSTITIAAVGASTADSGCPLTRNKLAMIDLRISDNILIERQWQNQYYLLNKGSLHDRAWCYQEVEISPRLLICGANELFWQCKKGKRRESDPLNQMLHRRPDLDLADNDSSSDEGPSEWSPIARILDQAVIPNSEKGYTQWHSIYSAYTELRLTFPDDKLRAISALAKRFATLVEGPTDPASYVCGLWRADLHKALLWESQGGRGSQRPKFRAPSWTWAAYDNQVRNSFMQRYNRPAENFCSEILDVSVEPVSQLNLFGPVKYGKLSIYGPLAGVPEEIYGTYQDEFARYSATGFGLFASQLAEGLDEKESGSGDKVEIRRVVNYSDGSDEVVYERRVYSRRNSASGTDSETGSRRRRTRMRSQSSDRSSTRSGRRPLKTTENIWFQQRGLVSWDIQVEAEMGHKILRMTEEYGIILCPIPRPGSGPSFQRIGLINVCAFNPKDREKLLKRFNAFDWEPQVVTII